jgi:hypothetical protein
MERLRASSAVDFSTSSVFCVVRPCNEDGRNNSYQLNDLIKMIANSKEPIAGKY